MEIGQRTTLVYRWHHTTSSLLCLAFEKHSEGCFRGRKEDTKMVDETCETSEGSSGII